MKQVKGKVKAKGKEHVKIKQETEGDIKMEKMEKVEVEVDVEVNRVENVEPPAEMTKTSIVTMLSKFAGHILPSSSLVGFLLLKLLNLVLDLEFGIQDVEAIEFLAMEGSSDGFYRCYARWHIEKDGSTHLYVLYTSLLTLLSPTLSHLTNQSFPS